MFIEKPEKWAFIKIYNIINYYKNYNKNENNKFINLFFILKYFLINFFYLTIIGFSKNVIKKAKILKNITKNTFRITKNIKNWNKKNISIKLEIIYNYMIFNILNKTYIEEEIGVYKKK